MVTIKEYAKKQNKTVQAVYKQLNAKSNKQRLEGHIYKNEINGKMTTFLDEEAEAILNNASKEAPIVIEKDNRNERIEELENQVKQLQAKIIELEERNSDDLRESQKRILELTDKLLLLETKEPPKKKHWWQW